MRLCIPNDDKVRTLPLGRCGENIVTELAFDVSDWLNEFGSDSTIRLLLQRPTDTAAYLCTTTIDGKYATYSLTAADLQYVGNGKAELKLINGTKIAKSRVYSTIVTVALDGSGTVPSVWQTWMDLFEDYVDRAETAADEAEAAEEAIENMTASASVDANVGTPSVTVTKTETSESFNLDFDFKNIKGTPGDSGVYVGSDTPPDTANVWVNPEGEVEDKFISYKGFFEDGETDMEDDIDNTDFVEYNGCIYHWNFSTYTLKGYNSEESRTWTVGSGSNYGVGIKIVNGKLVYGCYGRIYYATLPTDDTLPSASWTWNTSAISGIYIDGIFYCNSTYILYGRTSGSDYRIYTSTDLSTWTLATSSVTSNIRWIVYVDGYYYAIRTGDNSIYYTDNLSSGFSYRTTGYYVRNCVATESKVFVWCGYDTRSGTRHSAGYINTSHTFTIISADNTWKGDDYLFYDAYNKVIISSGYANRGATLVLGYSKDAVNWVETERSTSSVWASAYGNGCIDESASSYHADNIVLSYYNDDDERGVMTVDYDTEAEGFYNSNGDSLNYIIKNVISIPSYSSSEAGKSLKVNSSGTAMEWASDSSTKYVHNIRITNASGANFAQITAMLINASSTAITSYSGLVSALNALSIPYGSHGIPASGMYDTTFGSFQRFMVSAISVDTTNLACTIIEQTVSGSGYSVYIPSSDVTITDFVYAI